jgi:hypothetical protein
MKRLFFRLSLLLLVFAGCSNNSATVEKNSDAPTGLVKKKSDNQSALVNPGKVANTRSVSPITEFGERVMIKLTPFIPDYVGFSEVEKNLLSSRLNAAVAEVGYGGDGSNPRFIIGPAISILSKELTTGAPTLHSVTYEVNFLVVDIVDETVFASYTKQFKGVGQSPAKAFVSGFKNVNLKTAEFYRFLKKAETKINDYYAANCNKFLLQANAEIKERNYDAAYAILKNVPIEADECYTQAQKIRAEAFKAILSLECNSILLNMKAELGKMNDATASGFNDEALGYYVMIDKESSCYPEAEALYKKHMSGIKPEQKRDWELKMKQMEHEMNYPLDSMKNMQDFQIKMKELDTKAEIEGSKKLLDKYQKDFAYDKQPWVRRIFHLGDLDPFDGYDD